MENNEDETWNDETEINPEAWLQALLAMTGDKERKAELVRKISEKTGQTLEQVEAILAATINYLSEKARSN
jgi:hypothetical protein